MTDVNAVHDGDDALLLDLDALVSDRGRTAAARALGVNYRTMMNCYDSRRVSRRMRQALQEFRDAGGVVGDVDAEVVDGDAADMEGESLERRVAALEEENRGLRELVENQARQLEELGSRLANLEQQGKQPGDADPVLVDGPETEWRPPRRGRGFPDAGVVTLDEQPDEDHAFGPAAPVVKEWRQLQVGGDQGVSRVDRARLAVRRWELEANILDEFHLTLPPETHPLDDARRADHVRWRKEALAQARKELSRATRTRLIRRLLTLGLWRR